MTPFFSFIIVLCTFDRHRGFCLHRLPGLLCFKQCSLRVCTFKYAFFPILFALHIHGVTLTSLYLQELQPPCWRYKVAAVQTVACGNKRRSTHTLSANNLGVKIFRFPHFNSLSACIDYTSNMAAWFNAQGGAENARHENARKRYCSNLLNQSRLRLYSSWLTMSMTVMSTLVFSHAHACGPARKCL